MLYVLIFFVFFILSYFLRNEKLEEELYPIELIFKIEEIKRDFSNSFHIEIEKNILILKKIHSSDLSLFLTIKLTEKDTQNFLEDHYKSLIKEGFTYTQKGDSIIFQKDKYIVSTYILHNQFIASTFSHEFYYELANKTLGLLTNYINTNEFDNFLLLSKNEKNKYNNFALKKFFLTLIASFILGFTLNTIFRSYFYKSSYTKDSIIRDSVIQENGNYIAENDKFILKNLNGELFSILNFEYMRESFNELFEIKSGDKGNFSSNGIYLDKFSFSNILTLYHPNSGSKLFEIEINELDYSNSPEKDRNIIHQIISDQEKFNEYLEKGYIRFKDSVLTIFFSSEENKVKARITFTDSNISEGLRKLFYKNGNLNEVVYLKNGLPEGEIKSYYENGSLQGVGQFINGLEEGEWEEYYENGNLKNISYFSNGKLEGEQKFYFENGNLKNIIYFENGIPEGKYKEYHENGKLAISTTFKNGIQNGICEIYNKNGKLINKLYLYNWKN